MLENTNTSEFVNLFKSLFRGRDDVFSLRWEKGTKSGYMPAYFFDPYRYRIHKANGGTFQNFSEKSYLPFTNIEIEKHLIGKQLAGIYPLLHNNTSWFIVADFDKDKWVNECRIFLKACEECEIPAYLERSRSGNGGHVWIFFEQPYPAIQSRKIFISILEQIGSFSIFDKSSSFDRLFPNQDFLSGKGLGNLIALPFYKPAFDVGNSCFIDIVGLKPYANQHEFLKTIKRVPKTTLDKLWESRKGTEIKIVSLEQSKQVVDGKVGIHLNNTVHINREGLNPILINYLKEELNFASSEFLIKKKIGKNTWSTERYYKMIEEAENEVILPRGFLGKLLRFCRTNKIECIFFDERIKQNKVTFAFGATLKDYQNKAMDAVMKKDFGVIVAPPSAGKTIIGLKIIAEKQQPALIIVHRKHLMEQWIERIEAFLGISAKEIGKIGAGKSKIGQKITIATIQSLAKEIEKPNFQQNFGTIIIDECHHIPAETFRNTINKLHCFYLYGLTATPFRKYNDGKLIFAHIGEIITEIQSYEIGLQQKAKIVVRNTELDVPFNSKTDKFETLSKVLAHDTARNNLILNDIKYEVGFGKKIVIITERKEHIDAMCQHLKQSYETVILSGEDSETNRKIKWNVLKRGDYQILITTGQFFGEGTDLQNANCLFLVYPFSFEGKLIQYIGRVQRSEIAPTIYDYRDLKIDYLNKLFLKRNTYYRKLEKQSALFEETQKEPNDTNKVYRLDQQIKITLNQLEFRYGSFMFDYEVVDLNLIVEFEIENTEIRPEFEVLKPYFTKLLGTNYVNINIEAEFLNEKLVSALATSSDLDRINNEIIESVKFRFVTKNILGKSNFITEKKLMELSQIQINSGTVFETETELLDNLLKNKNVKHSRQLRYLAQKHESEILKIRFVLSPFSFVFLLAGNEQFHLILETLDTAEATYLWHIEKNINYLLHHLGEIDKQLNTIRNKGRQIFLELAPKNFSRIVHDYIDEKKGFIIWKDTLEERLW